MRPILIILSALLFSFSGLIGQTKVKSPVKKAITHKIVFQMVSKDTADHNALVRQLFNIRKLAPNTKLEVVCHGPGLTFIQKNKSLVLDKLNELAETNVDFVGCEFTMSQKNITRDQLMEKCRTVPGGILEIVDKQDKGWSYIKAGY